MFYKISVLNNIIDYDFWIIYHLCCLSLVCNPFVFEVNRLWQTNLIILLCVFFFSIKLFYIKLFTRTEIISTVKESYFYLIKKHLFLINVFLLFFFVCKKCTTELQILISKRKICDIIFTKIELFKNASCEYMP